MKAKLSIAALFFATLFLYNCSSDGDIPREEPIDRSANLLSTGDSAADILTNENFDRLLIEIAHVEGFRPTAEAIDLLTSFFAERTFKLEVQYQYRALASPGEETLTLQEVASLENDNRTQYNDGRTLAIYIYFADAPSDGDDEDAGLVTLGAVYRNTSMILYERTIRQLAGRSALITNADVEAATLTHEFGHLLGLVDLGTPEVNPHEDPAAENHCLTDGCLMRAELEFGGGLMGLMEKRAAKGMAQVPVLDAECINDLQAIGGR
ncbi:hypothetical protein ACT6NV_10060 [Robiginitalea sp. IMCC44478]|uniref:hypothetical protein n=1 Tax=Robiginitalea sp. IMCC44478 TaxID=3459122 RepID=UPI0040430372